MPARERAIQFVNRVPDSQLPALLLILQGFGEVAEVPNAETLAAIAEADEMIRTGSGPRFSSAAELSAYLDRLDEDEDLTDA